jgi:hypothetical protein
VAPYQKGVQRGDCTKEGERDEEARNDDSLGQKPLLSKFSQQLHFAQLHHPEHLKLRRDQISSSFLAILTNTRK